MDASEITYAGFWRRLQAWVVDVFLVVISSCVFALVVAIVLSLTVGLLIKDKTMINYIYDKTGAVVGLFTYFAYFVGFEVSTFQATPGKILFNIKVTDMNEERIGFVRAFARTISKFLSGFLLLLGFLICDFTPKKQTLHDIIANTLVLRTKVPTTVDNDVD